jgi:tetratricopeptide (TPR) repeat protein
MLSAEIGSPDTCTACHTDQDLEWAGKWVNQWWPREKDDVTRNRARAIQEFREGRAVNYSKLLQLAQSEEIILWKASLTAMLAPWNQLKEVEIYLRQSLNHSDPQIRSAAVRALVQHPNAAQLLSSTRMDTARSVRIQTAQVIGPDAEYQAEYEAFLKFNSDRPNNALMLADYFRGDDEAQQDWIQRAVSLDPSNEIIYADGAVLLARSGNTQAARELLQQGVKQTGAAAQIKYSLGLLEAEAGNYPAAADWLRQSLQDNPQQPRGWYNLSLILRRQGDFNGARQAAEKAYELAPNDPGILQLMQQR